MSWVVKTCSDFDPSPQLTMTGRPSAALHMNLMYRPVAGVISTSTTVPRPPSFHTICLDAICIRQPSAGVHTTSSIQPQSSPSETLPSLEYVHSIVCEPVPVISSA